MIKRAVGFDAPGNATASLCRTLVQSNLDCSSVRSPSTVSDIKYIEAIQRAATRYISIQKFNTSNDAPCLICIYFLTDVKLQIYYMFLNVLKVTVTCPGIIL